MARPERPRPALHIRAGPQRPGSRDRAGLGRARRRRARVTGRCTTVSIIAWADGRFDVGIGLYALPPGSDQFVRPGRLARAIAVGSRLYQAGATLDDVQYDVYQMVSYGSWGDLVLGALAWFGRARWLNRHPDHPGRADVLARQGGVRSYMTSAAPSLVDSRVLDALSLEGAERDARLDAILDEPAPGEPIVADALTALARRAIARGLEDHPSVARFQRVGPSAVFNVVWNSAGP